VKPLDFLGDSLDVLRAFPDGARRAAGFQLDRLQRGLEPLDWKPMTSIGPGAQEIRVREEGAAHAATGSRAGPPTTVRTDEDATMTTTKRTTFASVWDAIEDSREIAASLRLRAEVTNAIIEEIRRRKLTQGRAAALCNVTQPRVSDLMRGRLDLFSLDALIDMAAHLDLRTSVTVRRRRAA
jgi:predicted XRE-type DNA-binding protein